MNNFDKFNVLAIVIAIDKSIVTKNGPILSFWGSTNRHAGCDDAQGDCDEDGDGGSGKAKSRISNVQYSGCVPRISPA